ncbi:MAG: PEP-CTERM sorting domain-containing protein [Gemmatimonadaceae bacterium]
MSAPLVTATAQPSSLIPGLSASFVQPTGTVYSTSPIDVYVRLTLDAGAPAFNFDGTSYEPSSPMPFGLDRSLLPTSGVIFGTDTAAVFSNYDAAFLFLAFGCDGNFTNTSGDCLSGPPYTFTFGPGLPSSDVFSLAPGTSWDFVFGTFTPDGGRAPDGTYFFSDVELLAQIDGVDASGDIVIGSTPGLVDTCLNPDPTCAFTRSVVSTPEPATFGLLGLGLGFVGLVRRQRRKA